MGVRGAAVGVRAGGKLREGGGGSSLLKNMGAALPQLLQLELLSWLPEELPGVSLELRSLTSLAIEAPQLVALPQGMSCLSRLRKLELIHCTALQHLLEFLTQLHHLTLRDTSIRYHHVNLNIMHSEMPPLSSQIPRSCFSLLATLPSPTPASPPFLSYRTPRPTPLIPPTPLSYPPPLVPPAHLCTPTTPIPFIPPLPPFLSYLPFLSHPSLHSSHTPPLLSYSPLLSSPPLSCAPLPPHPPVWVKAD
ncbi:unnamed protein product [Closterium sp. NIES-65]|nr:unnamed protein product [Closterium sp. NIES-65]